MDSQFVSYYNPRESGLVDMSICIIANGVMRPSICKLTYIKTS